MKDLDIELYFENFRKDREQSIIDSVTQLMNHKFPDIQGLVVTLKSVQYDDPRYSLEEVTEYVMSLYNPSPMLPVNYVYPEGVTKQLHFKGGLRRVGKDENPLNHK